ncbi:hypothetical protein BH10ACT1_BH10ACT1_20410 [soil metagenome]
MAGPARMDVARMALTIRPASVMRPLAGEAKIVSKATTDEPLMFVAAAISVTLYAFNERYQRWDRLFQLPRWRTSRLRGDLVGQGWSVEDASYWNFHTRKQSRKR